MPWFDWFKKNRSGILLLDLVTSLTIIWFLIWLFGGIITTVARNAKETALRYQLNNFRMVLTLYKELKGQYPQDLEVLLKTDYKMAKENKPIPSRMLIINLKQNLQGAVLDVFGNPFYYDPGRGVIWPQTKGYENW